mmetsp:Transcript_69390/g.144913  ORF Transcript_69390/g.144913 Transcript_69390/m.144913 type:complete len:524 (+) Transcript_69390:798-2369(+)
MPETVVGLVPAIQVASRFELVGLGLAQLLAQDLLDLLPVPSGSVVLGGVLDSGVLSVGSVTEVALSDHDGFGDVLGVLGLAEADDIGQPGVRLLVVVGEAQATTNSDVEALQPVVLDDRNEASAMGEDIDVVAGRDGHSNLVLAREVGLAVQRFLFQGCGSHDLGLLCHLVSVHEEDLVVGSGSGQAVVVDGVGVGDDLVHHLAAADGGVGGAHHVSADVAASREGVHAGSVDGPHGVLHVALHDAVQLPGLSGGDLQGAVGVLAASLVHGQPLLGGAVASRQAHADHIAEGVLDAQLRSLLAQVAVVLLVGAMEFDHLRVVERNLAGGDVVQSGLQGASELVGLDLDHLVGLDRSVVVSSRCRGSFHAQARVQLALPLAEAGVVLVHILVVTEACGNESRRPQTLHQVVEVSGRLREVDAGLLRALAPIVGVPQAEDAVLHAGEGALELIRPGQQLLIEGPAIAAELSLAGGGDAEDDHGLVGDGTHVEGVGSAAADGAVGEATIAALAGHCLRALLGVPRV